MAKKKTNNSWSVQTRYFALTILFILGALFIWYVRPLIGPIVVSILLAYVLHPIAQALNNRTPLSQKASVIIVYLLFLGGLAYIPATVTPRVIEEIEAMDLDLAAVVQLLEDLSSDIEAIDIPFLNLEEAASSLQSDIIEFLRPENIFKTIESVTENVVWLLVILIITYFLMVDWEELRTWGFQQIPKGFQADGMRIYREISNIWGLYLRGQISSMVIVGLVSGVAALIIGLQGPLAVGLVAGALAMLPSVGSSLMVAVVGVASLFSPSTVLDVSTWWFVAIVVIVFTGIHIFDNYWLRPKILGGGLDLHESVILVGVIGGLTLGGVVLALIIVPLVSSVIVITRYTIRQIMGVDPWEGIEPLV